MIRPLHTPPRDPIQIDLQQTNRAVLAPSEAIRGTKKLTDTTRGAYTRAEEDMPGETTRTEGHSASAAETLALESEGGGVTAVRRCGAGERGGG